MVLAALSTAILTAACESQNVRDEDSQFLSVPQGSTLTMNREITIQPDQASVYLQNGKLGAARDVDFYKPHCKFELFTISTGARVVKPDTFVVIRIVDQSEDVSVAWPIYAGRGMAGDGPTHLTFSTTMYLESKIQPDVLSLDCKSWDDPV